VLTDLLDTSCLIAAQTPGELHHEAAAQLVEAGRAGRVHLLTATSVEYDLETASPERTEERHEWLSVRPFIRRVPGPFTLDVSRLDWGDILVSDAQRDTLYELQRIVGTRAPAEGPDEFWRRHQFDRHHVSAAFLARADALVTTDKRDLLDKARAIWDACGLRVLDPATALAQLDASA
jgi:hypothetical protein